MTSIVTEVLLKLKAAGKSTRESIDLKIQDLKRRLDFIQVEVQGQLKNCYVDFLPQYIRIENIIDRFEGINAEYEALHQKIEKEIKPQMSHSVTEYQDVIEDLKNIRTLKQNLLNIFSLHEHIECARKLISESTLDAVKSLLEFERVFSSIEPDKKQDIAIICAIRREYFVVKEDIIYRLQKIWRQKLVINYINDGKNKKMVMLTCVKNSDNDQELLKSLKLLKTLRPMLKEFGKQFLEMICRTLILNEVKIEQNEDTSLVLTITIVNEQSPTPGIVLENVKNVISFLDACLFHHPVDMLENDVHVTVMNEFGLAIQEDFCNVIIEDCLKASVPSQTKQLEAFHNEMVVTEIFCNDLLAIGFFPNSENKLVQFIHNVDTLPVNKMMQNILSRARSLMKQSLHQTVTVGIEPAPAAKIENPHDFNEMAKAKSGLSKSTFEFPRCQISSCVQDLVHLLKEIKDEAKNFGPVHSSRLYYCARSICELYCCVVPTYHKEEIENIPQQTGIYHNNCMYLSHRLCTLGSLYECELETSIQMTFVDLVQEIRKLGTEAFLTQLRRQRQQLFQLLQEEEALQSTAFETGVVNKSEKVIRQCLCQLQLLKKVWCEVLPTEVYFKAIGTLLNTCFEEITLRVLAMEDIAEEAAAQMDSTFDILIKKGPDLFQVPTADKSNVVHLYVKRWFKIQELQLVLRASMREIVDRWASGKGPLATHFTAEEVKHLIRALFQNTERRAAALAKIK
ncbi:centromere/kinetochore protein zw10 homolog [Uloborus diversus]|uniref:centromere/kinetochore protein zw10 homolog n=1 Tax=Uloborus diversus TaxID=327109 RepID=UPI002409AFF6|nr:centromere/kinetochore protein zw10 homolog [Uloborus diversus]